MHQNNCSSRAGRVFSTQNRLKQCFKHMFRRIIELLIISVVVQDHILLIFMKRNGTRETSLDNPGPDNRGASVLEGIFFNTH